MMREILFRAKRVDNGKWVYGDLVRIILCDKSVEAYIFCKGKVKLETVGQYTGLTDNNGNKIFEGDIVLFEDESPHNYEYHDDTEMRCGVIRYDDGQFYLTNRIAVEMGDLIYDGKLDGEVIGNVFDNADLLEVQDE